MSSKLLSSVLYHNVQIQQQSQRVCFQIILPRDTIRIVGIETSIRSDSDVSAPMQHYVTAGLLTLQAAGQADLCYSNYIMVESKKMLPTDLGYRYIVAGFINWPPLAIDAIAQWGHREPDILNIAAPRYLIGTYTDLWGAGIATNLTYRLSIHLWVTVNDLYNIPCS